MTNNSFIRNIAIVAHVDHGKTTMVDKLLCQSGTVQKVCDRIMDSNDIEVERGITILAKNTGIKYEKYTINIVDTPGHSDFGGEVERTLQMVEGFLLLVDAAEGVLPGTRFVLQKALALKLKPIVLINKIDRPDAEIDHVREQINDLFLDLALDESDLHFTILYGSSKLGFVTKDPNIKTEDCKILFETIVKDIPSPKEKSSSPQFLITNIDYSDYLGYLAVGRIFSGKFSVGDKCIVCSDNYLGKSFKITKLYQFIGTEQNEVMSAGYGDIVSIAGFTEQPKIGKTVCIEGEIDPCKYIPIDEPTVIMNFSVNDSPFAGKDGKLLTARHIKDRLEKELRTNVALRVESGNTPESFKASGRGQLHLGVLIENMRREGFELQVSSPKVIYKEINGQTCEPIELLVVDVETEHQGVVMQMLGNKKSELKFIEPHASGKRIRMEFEIPARGLLGFKSQFLTETRGTGIATFSFKGYSPFKGEIPSRTKGAIISMETGTVTEYALNTIQERGTLFVSAGDKIYKNQIVGENSRECDLRVNPCKEKKLTNMRASGSDDTIKIDAPKIMNLEKCMEWIKDDEFIEATPTIIRLLKK
jgi:GTP-binding protein